MKQEQQESIFVAEIQKTLERLASEFDLSTFFVIGALEVILHDIKEDLLFALNGEEDEESEETDV